MNPNKTYERRLENIVQKYDTLMFVSGRLGNSEYLERQSIAGIKRDIIAVNKLANEISKAAQELADYHSISFIEFCLSNYLIPSNVSKSGKHDIYYNTYAHKGG